VDHTSEPTTSSLPTDRRALLAGIGGLAAGALIAGKANAGPLNPPAGPIAPTPGPEPRVAINQTNTPGDANNTFRITQPGSYYFPGNLSGEPQKSGILIASSDVTIDMMGFRLQPVNIGSGSGILNSGARVNITIRNGVVKRWEGSGIDLSSGGASGQCSNVRIEGVTVAENLALGIRAGQNAIVQNCIAQANGDAGIRVDQNATVLNCTAVSNGGNGIQTGISATVSGCTASSNAAKGILVNNGSNIHACMAFGNSGNGIEADNGLGTISGCAAYDNVGNGFEVAAGCTILGCTAYQNSGIGINAGDGNTISLCTVRRNEIDGIRVKNYNLVAGNSCSSNGFGDSGSGEGAGIHVAGGGNRIEDNNCTQNSRGIDVDVFGNIIIRNTCFANTPNWDIVAGNSYLIVQATTTASNFTGNAGGSGVGSTNPHANFTY
jgi:hypothetical protein